MHAIHAKMEQLCITFPINLSAGLLRFDSPPVLRFSFTGSGSGAVCTTGLPAPPKRLPKKLLNSLLMLEKKLSLESAQARAQGITGGFHDEGSQAHPSKPILRVALVMKGASNKVKDPPH